MDNSPMDLLNQLISNPESAKNIKDMLKNMSTPTEQEPVDEGLSEGELISALPLINEFLNNKQNGEMLRKINKAYTGYSNNMTPGLQLLDALKPYLSQHRSANLEKIRKVIKISNAFSELKK